MRVIITEIGQKDYTTVLTEDSWAELTVRLVSHELGAASHDWASLVMAEWLQHDGYDGAFSFELSDKAGEITYTYRYEFQA